jgi:putative AbiEi antitoxin of type IV toxin-antitoxin system
VSYSAGVPRPSTVGKLARISQDQWGLVTRRQAEQTGISRATFTRLVADGFVLERVAPSVYRLIGGALPDHFALRAAWLQLDPSVPAWERRPDDGVVSHRSAAAVYGVGHLPADVHEFTLPRRRQSRRPDVRLHRRKLRDDEWVALRGLPVTRPSRIAADLLAENEDPEAVAQIIADAIRSVYDDPGSFADALAPYAARFGLRRGDGLSLLRWMLELVADPDRRRWLDEAQAHLSRDRHGKATTRSRDQEPIGSSVR